MTRSRKIEKWTDIIRELNIDVSKSKNFVTADQIKNITGEEPRLMAKMDSYDSLPKIFKENNLFLIPISRKAYVILKGTGYHTLENIANEEMHYTSLPFPESAIGTESESVFLDYANSCGLLGKLCSAENLILTFRGRRTTPKFDLNIKDSETKVTVDRAQIEVDSAYEAPDQIIIFEAKLGYPQTFNLKQLYYPFRTFYGKKKVRCFFFYLIPLDRIYLFWEYLFDPYDTINSIRLINSRKFRIKLSNPISIQKYQSISPKRSKLNIPQADDINKIIQFPMMVLKGYDTSEKMIEAFGFVKRQSSYYRQASELLGLVTLYKNKYKLTDMGNEFLKLRSEEKSNFVCKLLLEFPVMNEIFLRLSIDKNKTINRNDIIDVLRNKSHISGSTLSRRTQTIVSWFRWIRNNIGLVDVDRYGNIAIQRQLKTDL